MTISLENLQKLEYNNPHLKTRLFYFRPASKPIDIGLHNYNYKSVKSDHAGALPLSVIAPDLRLLLEKSTSLEQRSIILFAVLTAMRIGEIVNLEWSDIDLARKEIWMHNKPGFQVKGGSERLVPIHDLVVQLHQSKVRTSQWVFANARGGKCAVGNVSRHFKELTRTTDLPEDCHLHSLRHTSLTWLHSNGIPSEFVRQIAGHASIKTTQIYLHSTPQHLLNAVYSIGI